MELNVKFEIKDLFGGDGIERFEEFEKQTYETKRTVEKSRAGFSGQDSEAEKKMKVTMEPILTFKGWEDGNFKNKPEQRLGGVHGKMWGSLRATGKYLADIQDEVLEKNGIKSKASIDRMMMAINLSPIYPEIKNISERTMENIPQITAGISKSLMVQHFDVIKKCNVDMKIKFPDKYKKVILHMLRTQEEMSTLNKRRAQVIVLNWKDLGGN